MLDEKSLRIFEEHNLLSLRIRELECDEKSFTFEDDPLDLTIKKMDDGFIEVVNERFKLHGYGLSIEEAWQDFTELFENAMYMIFDSGKPVSKSCQGFVDWAKTNVKERSKHEDSRNQLSSEDSFKRRNPRQRRCDIRIQQSDKDCQSRIPVHAANVMARDSSRDP